jgi:mRNA interferase MazF
VICEPFDIVVVPFPFSDRPASKRRPALVVSSSQFNRGHGQLMLAMISSTTSEWPSDVAIAAWRAANLSVPCKVRFKLFTLDRTLIVRKLGRLSPEDHQAVTKALSRWMAVT